MEYFSVFRTRCVTKNAYFFGAKKLPLRKAKKNVNGIDP